MKPLNFFIFLLFSIPAMAQDNIELKLHNPAHINIIYTIEPDEISVEAIQTLVQEMACKAGIGSNSRDDAQLFVRVEKHAGSYLLYLDFNRSLFFNLNNKSYPTKGFVWGRYAKNIHNVEELLDDVTFFAEEFFSDYKQANNL